jgi:hypothetical protein
VRVCASREKRATSTFTANEDFIADLVADQVSALIEQSPGDKEEAGGGRRERERERERKREERDG